MPATRQARSPISICPTRQSRTRSPGCPPASDPQAAKELRSSAGTRPAGSLRPGAYSGRHHRLLLPGGTSDVGARLSNAPSGLLAGLVAAAGQVRERVGPPAVAIVARCAATPVDRKSVVQGK